MDHSSNTQEARSGNGIQVLSRRPHLQAGVTGAQKLAHLRRGRGRECKKQRGKEGGGMDTGMAVTTASDGKISLNNNSVR